MGRDHSERRVRMEEISTSTDRDVIDGQAVIARQKATTVMNGAMNDGEAVTLTMVDECLLADGRTVYQCAHAKRPCAKWDVNPRSINSHLRTHSDRVELKRVLAEKDRIAAEKAVLDARAERQRQNRSNGARKAAEARRAQTSAVPTTAPAADADISERLAKLGESLARTSTELQKIGGTLQTLGDNLAYLLQELNEVTLEVRNVQPVNPALTELAAVLAKLNIKQ